MYKAIDVSDNQGVIRWPEVAAAGVKHAILRSIRRSGSADKQFAANLTGCQANGIRVEVYKYTYATTPAQAREEAKQVVDLLAYHNLTCRVWWDVEDGPVLVPLGRQQLTACIRAAREVIEAAGLPFGIYTGLAFFKAGYFDTEAFDCPYWIARYPLGNVMVLQQDPPAAKKPEVAGDQLWGWQYTSRGRVPGISGPVDVSLVYADSAVEELPAPARPKYYLQEAFGESITAALQAIGEDGSFARRDQIAAVNGVRDYTGNAAQNLKLLKLLRSGKLLKP